MMMMMMMMTTPTAKKTTTKTMHDDDNDDDDDDAGVGGERSSQNEVHSFKCIPHNCKINHTNLYHRLTWRPGRVLKSVRIISYSSSITLAITCIVISVNNYPRHNNTNVVIWIHHARFCKESPVFELLKIPGRFDPPHFSIWPPHFSFWTSSDPHFQTPQPFKILGRCNVTPHFIWNNSSTAVSLYIFWEICQYIPRLPMGDG